MLFFFAMVLILSRLSKHFCLLSNKVGLMTSIILKEIDNLINQLLFLLLKMQIKPWKKKI